MLRRYFRYLPLSDRAKKHLKFAYYKAMSLCGLEEYPALNALDRKMLKYLPQRGGVFVEAGANDGITQSNTWFLEAYRGWSGLLVEPVPGLAGLAKRFRRAKVVNVALGAAEMNGSNLALSVNDLMTTANAGAAAVAEAQIEVPVRSLSSLLDEGGFKAVDFLSLDVEGYELSVLKGLDLDRHRPRFILVETADFDGVSGLLGARYDFREALSFHDYLFEARAVPT